MITGKARSSFQFLPKELSSEGINYASNVAGAISALGLLYILFPVEILLCANLLYFLQICFKLFLINSSISHYEQDNSKLDTTTPKYLPRYSILIPAYKEVGKIVSIIDAMASINYPHDKMDVKILLEEDDILTRAFISRLVIPCFIEILIVPDSHPKTKPKALNYALGHIKGEIVVVYDVEDIPHPNQLLDAASRFAGLGDEYICLQASLNFYNSGKNLLTKVFSIEYRLWFDYILRGLDINLLPLTLGGTSNHFKAGKLKEIGGWDAFNVTEDAELGMRIYNLGYKAQMIDSITMEQAPAGIRAWIMQRIRWIKGFIQTSILFIKQSRFLKKQKINNLSLAQRLSAHAMLSITPVIFITSPLMFLSTALSGNESLKFFLMMNFFFSCAYLYFGGYIAMFDIKKRKKLIKTNWLERIAILVWPGYFIMHSISAYASIAELIKKPFHWNKTHHSFE